MWIFAGLVSGRKAADNTVPINLLSSTMMTVYSAGSIALSTTQTNMYEATVGDGIGEHMCGPINPPDINGHFIVAASIDALANPVGDTSYIPEAGWTSSTTTKRPRNTLAVSFKEDSTGFLNYSNEYQHTPYDYHDGVDAMFAYSAGGSSIYLRDSSDEFPTTTGQLEVKFPIASEVGDTAIWVICHVGELEEITGWNFDYTQQVLGTNQRSDVVTRQTRISVYSKILTADDLTNGYETIRIQDTPVVAPSKSLPPWDGVFAFDGYVGGGTFGTVTDPSVGGRFVSVDE